MRIADLKTIVLAAAASAFGAPTASHADVFTWQGKLVDAGQPAEGFHDFQFSLWDDLAGGNQVSITITALSRDLVDGLVNVELDFVGPNVFDGSPRWLEVAVRESGGGGFQTLSPRQPVNPTPYAMHAISAGTVEDGSLPSTYANPVNFTGAGNSYIGSALNIGSGALYASSKVGVGTMTPEVKLTVDGGTDAAAFGGGYLQLGAGVTKNLAFDDNEIMARDGGAASELRLNQEGGDILLNATGNVGNVGIGTFQPMTKLHIENGAIHLSSSTHDISVPNGEKLQIGHFDGVTFTERLFMNNDGRVGINTTTTGNGRLEVKQAADNSGEGVAVLNTAGTRGVRLWADAADVARLDSGVSGSGDLALNAGGGFVGISTTNPQSELHVEGNIHVSGTITTDVKTRWYSMNAAEFIPDDIDSGPYQIGVESINVTGFNDDGFFFAPIHLPHGATIKHIRVRIDKADAQFFYMQLISSNNNTGATTVERLIDMSSASPGVQIVTSSNINKVVDNANESLILKLTISHDNGQANPDAYFYNARIEYTIEGLD